MLPCILFQDNMVVPQWLFNFRNNELRMFWNESLSPDCNLLQNPVFHAQKCLIKEQQAGMTWVWRVSHLSVLVKTLASTIDIQHLSHCTQKHVHTMTQSSTHKVKKTEIQTAVLWVAACALEGSGDIHFQRFLFAFLLFLWLLWNP